MTTVGQLNKLAEEIKDFIVNGMEADNSECGDGTPAYGGTGTGEDFAGFSIYCVNLDEIEEADDELDLPLIVFHVLRSPFEELFDGRLYQADIDITIWIPEKTDHTKTIGGNVYSRSELLGWYIERLEYILQNMAITSVKTAGRGNPESLVTGKVQGPKNDFMYEARTSLSITFLEENTGE